MKDSDDYSYYYDTPVSRKEKKGGPGYIVIIAIALICSIMGGMFTYAALSSGGYLNKEAALSASPTPTNPGATLAPGVTDLQPGVTAPTIDSENPIVDLVKKVENAVVAVYTITTTTKNGVKTEVITGGGSGFIINQDGYIVTNNHVIADAEKLQVVLYNGNKYDAELVGTDEREDIAVLKIEATETLVCAALGQSANLQKGEYVLAIGNPLGQEGSVTLGVVSAVNRKVVSDGKRFTMIQTDAAINPGNSGGPLFNVSGEVVGINTMKEIQTYDEYGNTIPTEGLGYAIPMDIAQPIIAQLISKGEVTRPVLGVTCGTNYDSAGDAAGVIIATITAGGAAEEAGLKVNDVITKYNDVEITALEDMIEQLDLSQIGDKVTLTITRDGKTITLTVTLKSSS